MTDTMKIEPALTESEWKRIAQIRRDIDPELQSTAIMHLLDWIAAGDESKAMAVANASLPDDDPRKITHDDVRKLRVLADENLEMFCSEMAAKLAALLPPR